MKLRYLFLACVVAIAGACGGKTPVGPGPVVTNTPPVIGTFTVQGTRTNEPPNFADLQEELPISVEVTDAESNVSDLKFNWSATVGTFTGTGRSVVWKAPAGGTPRDVTIILEVVETFTSEGRSVENKPTGSTKVSLHDSVKEVGDMARQFLEDFSDSTIKDVQYIMRNFQPDCYGTAAETVQVADNRRNFQIIESRLEPLSTTVNFGGSCPFPGRSAQRGDACSYIRAYWRSNVLRSPGVIETATGIDHIAAMYDRDQKQWRLCDSQFEGSSSQSLRGAIRSGLVPTRGMVP